MGLVVICGTAKQGDGSKGVQIAELRRAGAHAEAVAEQILAAEWKRQPRQEGDLKTRLKGGYGKSGGGRPVAGDDADRGRRETSSAADLGADSGRTPT